MRGLSEAQIVDHIIIVATNVAKLIGASPEQVAEIERLITTNVEYRERAFKAIFDTPASAKEVTM